MFETVCFRNIYFLTFFSLSICVAQAQSQQRPPLSREEFVVQKSKVQEQLKQAGSDTAKVRLTLRLAALEAQFDVSSGIAMANEGIQLAKKTGHNESIARGYYTLSAVQNRAGRSEEELESLRLGLPYAEKMQSTELSGSYYDRMAMIYDMRGVYDKSLDLHLKAHAIFEKNKMDERRIAAKKLNIGNVLGRTGKHREAINWFEKAAVIYQKLEMWDHLAGVYNNIGGAWQNLDETQLSEQAYAKAAEYAALSKKKATSPAQKSTRNK